MTRIIESTRQRLSAQPLENAPSPIRAAREAVAGTRGAGVEESWQSFTAALAGALAVLEKGQNLILNPKGSSYSVQFAHDGRSGLRGEAVSNTSIRRRERLDQKQEARLLRVGWSAPTGDKPKPSGAGSPSFHRNWGMPVDTAQAAALAALTLRRVYGVRRPSDLRYRAFATAGGEIFLPTLGVERERMPRSKATARVTPISTRDDLLREVRRSLVMITDTDRVAPDEDGDFPLMSTSGIVYVRVRDDEPAVSLFSWVVTGVRSGPALLDALNTLNTTSDYVSFKCVDNAVMASLDLHCSPFVPDHFVRAVGCICGVVDAEADELRRRFGDGAGGDVEDPLADVNHSAGRATAAWLTGEGLAAATEKLRSAEDEDPIPAPLMSQWRARLVESTTGCVESADTVLALVNREAGLAADDIRAMVDRCRAEAEAAERCCRALAQLALGVTSHTEWCEETARLERAAVLVLADSGVDVNDEQMGFSGENRSDLTTEAAGLLCWMLTQQQCRRFVGNPGAGRASLEILVDDESNLVVRHNGDELSWSAPVTVLEPATYIADFFSQHGGAPLDA